MNYLTKKSLAKKIFGIENYTPGNKTTKSLVLRITSGTMEDVPSLMIVTIPKEEGLYHQQQCMKTYIPFMARIYFDQLLFVRDSSRVQQLLCLDEKDLENPLFGQVLKALQPVDFYTTPY